MPTCFLFGALFSVLLFQYQGGVSLLIVLKTLSLFETGVSNEVHTESGVFVKISRLLLIIAIPCDCDVPK